MQDDKIAVGISSCLLGEKVRFDGGHKNNVYIRDVLGKYFDFRPFCPEVSIGLGIPREAVRLVVAEDGLRCVGTRTPGLDVTNALSRCAEAQTGWQKQLCGYILKKDSPSCGMERVKLYRNGVPERNATGIYAGVLMQHFPHLPVEEEGRLQDAVLCENFVQRVFVYARFRQLLSEDIGWHALTRFHARHKYLLYSHNQNLARSLGGALSHQEESVSEFAQLYLAELMRILRIPATRKNHVNVLQHIQGYLKKRLDGEYRRQLGHAIEQYRLGLIPLIVPLTLLRHHFQKHPDNYIADSYYLQPYPDELKLLNRL